MPQDVGPSPGGQAQKQNTKPDAMLAYFLSVIAVRAQWLATSGALSQAEQNILAEINKGRTALEAGEAGTISEDAAWTEAYRLERLMALLEPLDSLLPTIRLRLDEAASEGVGIATEARLRSALTVAEARALDSSKTPPELRASEEPSLRALLLDILEETHWTLQRKFHGRPLQKRATSKVVWVGLGSFVLSLVPYIWIYVGYHRGSSLSTELWAWLPLYTALTAGLFGACFSRLLYIQNYAALMSLGELNTANDLRSILVRGSVGMCGALIVFFFLQSEIVKGSLFPEFLKIGLQRTGVQEAPAVRLILPNKDMALLFIWCFLAGFSERLVPTILSSTETTFEGAAKGMKK